MNKLINKLLSELADELDITESQEGAVKKAYNSVADWLNEKGTIIAKHDVHIFPQGSMMYGTAIKPINEDDYDIDLVCEFTKNIESVTPEYVKKSVGFRLKENNNYKRMIDDEGRRCWTLQYSDNLNFHMDILPAIPFSERYRTSRNLYDAYNSITVSKDLALLATDKNKTTNEYSFIPTNPHGFAEWFKGRIQIKQPQLLFDSVERLPSYPRKTVLQKSVQLLKRYRDVCFAEKDDLKPISMIITTLLAKCYNGETDVFDFICEAINKIPSLIEKNTFGEYIIRNPVMASENFADKWKEKPEKADAFFYWLKEANQDFKKLGNLELYSDIAVALKKMFAQKPVDRLMEHYKANLQKEYSELIEIKPIELIQLERISYRKSPPWALPKGYRVGIQALVSYDGGNNYKEFKSETILPKNVSLHFFPVLSIAPPYKVKWQITNTGNEAIEAGCPRGDKFESGELVRSGIACGKEESTAYTGKHYVQCFIIKNGNQCVGVSKPFIVNIK